MRSRAQVSAGFRSLDFLKPSLTSVEGARAAVGSTLIKKACSRLARLIRAFRASWKAFLGAVSSRAGP